MKQVPESILEEYNGTVNALASAACAMFREGFAELVASLADSDGLIPDSRIAELRDGVVKLLNDIGGAANESAAAIASEFYDSAREAAIGSPLGLSASAKPLDAANDAAVRAMVQEVVESGDPARFGGKCAQRIDSNARKACAAATVELGGRDRLRPRYARVPQGSETCRFCIMLASRGAVYASELTAGAVKHFHPNCDCKIVPDWGGGIEGYDEKVDYYYDVYSHPEKHPEINEAINARRRELYREKHPKKAKGGPVKWSDPEIEALATPDDVASWLASRDIEATDRFLRLPIETQKGAIAGFKHAVDRYGECDVARFDSISDSVNMGKYDPLTSTIKISDQVDDSFLTGLHEAMHALDNRRSGKMGSLDDDAYSRSVIASVRKKLRVSSDKKYNDILLDFTGWDLRFMEYLFDEQSELIPVAAESLYLGRRSKLGDALLEEVLKYDQV